MDIRTEMARKLHKPVLKPTLEQIHRELSKAKRVKLELGEITFDKGEAAFGERVNFQGYFTCPAKPPEKALVMVRMRIDTTAVIDLCSRELIIIEGETITSGTIKEAYTNCFAEVLSNAWWLADPEYKPCDLAKIQQVVTSDPIDQMKYELPWFDCDDFAAALYGAFHHDRDCAAMPIFYNWVMWTQDNKTYGHAVVSFYDGEKAIIIEPQTDEFFEVPEGWKLWLLVG